jgi:hypothetical protein
MDGWREFLDPQRWWEAIAAAGLNVESQVHEPYALSAKLPWDHVNVKFGRAYLEKEQGRSANQLAQLATVSGTS